MSTDSTPCEALSAEGPSKLKKKKKKCPVTEDNDGLLDVPEGDAKKKKKVRRRSKALSIDSTNGDEAASSALVAQPSPTPPVLSEGCEVEPDQAVQPPHPDYSSHLASEENFAMSSPSNPQLPEPCDHRHPTEETSTRPPAILPDTAALLSSHPSPSVLHSEQLPPASDPLTSSGPTKRISMVPRESQSYLNALVGNAPAMESHPAAALPSGAQLNGDAAVFDHLGGPSEGFLPPQPLEDQAAQAGHPAGGMQHKRQGSQQQALSLHCGLLPGDDGCTESLNHNMMQGDACPQPAQHGDKLDNTAPEVAIEPLSHPLRNATQSAAMFVPDVAIATIIEAMQRELVALRSVVHAQEQANLANSETEKRMALREEELEQREKALAAQEAQLIHDVDVAFRSRSAELESLMQQTLERRKALEERELELQIQGNEKMFTIEDFQAREAALAKREACQAMKEAEWARVIQLSKNEEEALAKQKAVWADRAVHLAEAEKKLAERAHALDAREQLVQAAEHWVHGRDVAVVAAEIQAMRQGQFTLLDTSRGIHPCPVVSADNLALPTGRSYARKDSVSSTLPPIEGFACLNSHRSQAIDSLPTPLQIEEQFRQWEERERVVQGRERHVINLLAETESRDKGLALRERLIADREAAVTIKERENEATLTKILARERLLRDAEQIIAAQREAVAAAEAEMTAKARQIERKSRLLETKADLSIVLNRPFSADTRLHDMALSGAATQALIRARPHTASIVRPQLTKDRGLLRYTGGIRDSDVKTEKLLHLPDSQTNLSSKWP